MRKIILLLLFWPFTARAELKFDIHRFTESETMQMRQFTEPGIEWRLAQFVAPGMLSVMPVPSSTPPAPCSGTNYYVSNSGNNSNNGTSTSTPWQTIAKVNTGPGGLFQGGNCINFNGAQTFTGNLTLASGGNVGTITPANPIVIQSYGTGRATLQATTGGGDEDAAVRITDINSFTFRNLIVRPGSSPPRWCVDINGSSGGVVTGIDVGGCTALTLAVGHYSVDILIRSSNAVTVSNNTVSGIAGVTSKDDTGINADGMSAAYSIIGNTILNIGGRTGADGGANGTSGNGITTNNNGNSLGTVAFNLIHDTGANTNNCGGPSGILAYNMGNLTVSSNEVYNIRPLNNTYPGLGCDWDGIDLDGGVLNSIVEYNYTHNNGGAGLLAFMGPVDNNWGPNTYRYNISENDLTLSQLNGFFGAVTFSNEGGALPLLRFYNNTIYNSLNAPNNSAISITNATPAVASGSIIANNMIITTGNNKILSCNLGNFANITFRNNGYYTSGGTFSMGANCGGSTSTSLAAWMTASGETGATTANPVLFAGVPAGTCTWTPSALSGPQPCPTAYQPLSASYLSTGVNLTVAPFNLNVGTRDYYGNPIPNGTGTGYNIGAYGAGAGGPPPPVGVYGPRVTVGPVSTVTCPAGAVSINPGTNIQTVVNAHSAGTNYCLTVGTHNAQEVVPKAGDIFTGQLGTTMDGGGTAVRAFSGTAAGVTIKNLVITNYKPGIQRAMVGQSDGTGVNGWLISNNDIKNAVMTGPGGRCSNCGGIGLAFQNGSQVTANLIRDNASMGFSCYGPNDVFTDNEISGNNPGYGTDPAWEAGANKCWLSINERFQNNYSHDNNGPGMWFDNGNYGAVIQNNRIENNSVGIMWEISGDAEISFNKLVTNQVADASCQNWMWCADILLSSSGATSGKLIEVHDNLITTSLLTGDKGAGLSIISQNRGDRFEATRNIHTHNNTVTFTGGLGKYGAAQDWGDTGMWSDNITFNNDTFVNAGNNFWWSDQSNISLAAFRAFGLEATQGPGATGPAACSPLFTDNFASGYATNWNVGFPWEAGTNVYSATYVQANPTVSPGMNAFTTGAGGLTIGAKLTNGDPDAQGRTWYTGLLASKLTRITGYFEFVSAMPLSPGSVNGANWIYPVSASQNAEIDVIEHTANIVHQTIHNPADFANPTQDTTLPAVTNFHTYGADWQNDFITFYIDGVQKFQTTTLSNYKLGIPMQMVLSVNIVDPTSDGTTIPQFMTVKNVGAYVNKAARDACAP